MEQLMELAGICSFEAWFGLFILWLFKKSELPEVADVIALTQNAFAVTTEQKYVFWYKI